MNKNLHASKIHAFENLTFIKTPESGINGMHIPYLVVRIDVNVGYFVGPDALYYPYLWLELNVSYTGFRTYSKLVSWEESLLVAVHVVLSLEGAPTPYAYFVPSPRISHRIL